MPAIEMVKEFPQQVFQEILYRYSPDHIRGVCSLYNESQGDPDFFYEREFFYRGLLFKDNRVYACNIMVYNDNNWDRPQYLEITSVLVDLLPLYHIFHLVEVVCFVLQKYYRESLFVEKSYLHFKHYNKKHNQRFNYECEKHKQRERKYIIREGYEVHKEWHRILFRAATRTLPSLLLSQHKRKRPTTLFFLWDAYDELCRAKDELLSSQSIRRRIENAD